MTIEREHLMKRVATMFSRFSLLIVALMVSGCATLFASSPEIIEVKSEPPGASFKFGPYSGTTPATISVPRKSLKEYYTFNFSKEGYQDTTASVTTKVQGITWLGILWWPALVIDLASGNGYELENPHVMATLVRSSNHEQIGETVREPVQMVATSQASSQIAEQIVKRNDLKSVEEAPSQNIEQLRAGVVKITAKSLGGPPKSGTGIIVRSDGDVAYIATAAHVVAGDPQPSVEFFTKRNVPVVAEVLGLEGDDDVRGLALLVVRGLDRLPKGLKALPLAETLHFSGGEDIIMIGFPGNSGPWAVVKGNISARRGRDLFFSPAVDSGHSGGPILQNGKVVGLIAVAGQSSGRGVIARSVHDYVEGFGVRMQ